MATIVKAEPGDTTDSVIRKFKKKVMLDDVLADYREKEFYKKPSEIRKEKMAEKRRNRKRGSR